MIQLILLEEFFLFTSNLIATGKKILTDKDYKEVMTQIDTLMAKGSANVTKSELSEIRKLSLAAQH